jgi:adenosylhomocysteine nucleosidase
VAGLEARTIPAWGNARATPHDSSPLNTSSNPPSTTALTLIVFAVKEEARPFQKRTGSCSHLRVLLTGIGQRNADRMIRQALAEHAPQLVLTCGFAGGLNPELETGSVLFSADEQFGLSPALQAAGARPARFHCADKVVATAEAKRAMWQNTGADAVEMESGIIRAVCRERTIPSATVRVISDAAREDLPLDFNRVLDAEQNLSYARLAAALVKSPRKVGELLKLQRQTKAAAERLAQVLAKAIAAFPGGAS